MNHQSVVPPFDRAEVIENLGGDEALFREVAALFVADWPQREAALRSALATGTAEPLRAAAHAIKGAVGNFAAERAMTAARSLEMSCKAGDLSRAAEQADELVAEVGKVLAALRAENA